MHPLLLCIGFSFLFFLEFFITEQLPCLSLSFLMGIFLESFCLFTHLWLFCVLVAAPGLPVAAVRWGSCLLVCGLLLAMASLLWSVGCADRGLQQSWAQWRWLRALERRPDSCGTWDSSLQGTWDLPGSGMEPCRLPWQWILDHGVTRKALTQTFLKGIKLV